MTAIADPSADQPLVAPQAAHILQCTRAMSLRRSIVHGTPRMRALVHPFVAASRRALFFFFFALERHVREALGPREPGGLSSRDSICPDEH